MKLEQQVVSLELARKLKELGVDQKSLFYIDEQDQEITYGMFVAPTFPGHTYISTFTVAELGEMLPTYFHKDGREYRITIVNGNGLKYIDYAKYKNSRPVFLLNGYPMLMDSKDTEADARAKCLVYLLENKLIIE